MHSIVRTLSFIALMAGAIHTARSQEVPRPETSPNTALVNGRWFNGNSFEPRTVYSVGGRFTSEKPARLDRTLDLAGLWIIPPYADAHNHSIGTGQVELDKIAVRRYLSDGVFYVKMQANIPIDEEIKKRIGLGQPDSVDAMLAQEAITASHSHPAELADIFFFPNVYVPGFSKEIYERASIGPVDTVEELDRKWPAILAQKPDFIKAILIYSDEYEKRKNDRSGWIHALDPRVLARIVEKAHAAHLRVSVHVNTSADFHNALMAGADEIAHLPLTAVTPISREDVELAAARGVVVDTTCAEVPTLPPFFLPAEDRPQILKVQLANLKLLHDYGVTLAIGTDSPPDTSRGEVEYLRGLKVFDDLTLLKMWTETTPQSIFPSRKIGALREGYEASFLALEGNPLEDWRNAQRIRVRFKQGFLMETQGPDSRLPENDR
jgi:imidazolonepropionase-like amidohydrolase